MSSFIYKSATDLARLIREGKASSVEIVREHLDQIHTHNPGLNAIIISLESDALKVAAECDAESKEGKFRGPLHGVPITVKEQYWIKGTKSTLNTKRLKNWTAPEDAVVVSRLKNAGAVILGKTNIAKDLLDYQVNGDIYPDCLNPYNSNHSPGGSSGGSASAVSSGMSVADLGGDFGGSIRVPANFCGLYGLKPTESVVPGHGNAPKPSGAKSYIFHMATAGPIARNPEDLDLMWNVIKGPHKSDRTTPRIAWEMPESDDLSKYKLAWVDSWPGYDTSKQTKNVIGKFNKTLLDNGANLTNSPPGNDLHERSLDIHRILSIMMTSQDVPPLIKPLMIMDMKKNFLRGIKGVKWKMKDSLIAYSEIMGRRAQVISEWEDYFEEYDFLICPSAHGPAMKRCKIGTPIISEGKKIIYLNYVWPYNACFNASGHPAISIPMGIGEEGLPVGVQVVGPYWSEPKLIHFAKLVSRFTPGFVKPEGY